jgi:hypothetical protein
MTATDSTYVYAIIRGREIRSTGGLDRAPTRVVESEGIAAIVSSVRELPVKPTRANLAAHHEVIERAAGDTTVLPMRFGFVMSDEDEVASELLQPHRDELLEQLTRFDGHVELGVKVYYREDSFLRDVVREDRAIARLREATQRLTPEAGYYQRIRLGELVFEAVDRKRREQAGQIRRALEPLASAVASDADPPDRVVLKAAFLVEDQRVPEFEERVEDLASRNPDALHFKLVGPVPPYSFVTVAASEPAAVPWA